MTALLIIPIIAFLQMQKSPGDGFKEKVKFASQPTEKWQPGDPKYRKTPNFSTDPREDDVFMIPEEAPRNEQLSTYC